jgi:polysaccharide biosynthesis protein PslG
MITSRSFVLRTQEPKGNKVFTTFHALFLLLFCLGVLLLAPSLEAQDSPSTQDVTAPAGSGVSSAETEGIDESSSRIDALFAPQTLGLNIHSTSALPGEMEMMAASGVRWIRTDLDWASTEQSKGIYDFSAYDRLMATLNPYGIRALLILDYANPLYDNGLSPYDDVGRKAFAEWAKAAVCHFAGRGILWEMYNEPDLTWTPKPNAEDYAKLALTVGQALHAAASNEIYVGPALSYLMKFSFLETSLKAGLLQYWTAVSVHPYRQTPPETVESDYNTLHALIAKYAPPGKQIPIICSEWGYSTVWSGFDEVKQAKFLAREWMTNLINGIPFTIWYDWRNDPANPKDPEEANFGVVLRPYHRGRMPVFNPKPAYFAATTVNSFLDGYHFVKRVEVGSKNDFVLLFKKDGSTAERRFRLAAWTEDADHPVVIPVERGTYSDLSYLGKSLPPLTADSRGLTITLVDAPQYLAPE